MESNRGLERERGGSAGGTRIRGPSTYGSPLPDWPLWGTLGSQPLLTSSVSTQVKGGWSWMGIWGLGLWEVETANLIHWALRNL